jgi:hypothetical protein
MEFDRRLGFQLGKRHWFKLKLGKQNLVLFGVPGGTRTPDLLLRRT